MSTVPSTLSLCLVVAAQQNLTYTIRQLPQIKTSFSKIGTIERVVAVVFPRTKSLPMISARGKLRVVQVSNHAFRAANSERLFFKIPMMDSLQR